MVQRPARFTDQVRCALAQGLPIPYIRGGDGSTEPTPLADLLARVDGRDELDDEALVALEGELTAAFDAAADGGDVEAAQQLTDAVDSVRETGQSRIEAAEAREAQIAEMRARVHVPEDEVEEPAAEAEAETPEVEAEPETPPAEPEAEVAEPIAAAVEPPAEEAAAVPVRRTPIAALARRSPPPPARTEPARRPASIRAAADLNGRVSPGAEISWHQAAELMIDRMSSVGDHQGPEISMRLGSVDWRDQYPADRTLTASMNAREVSDRVDAVVDPQHVGYFVPDQESLVAAGGLCAPTPMQYDLEVVSTDIRPLRTALPSFNADRGGVRFFQPFLLSEIQVDQQSGSAVDEVSVAEDASGNTKTIYISVCPDTPTEVQVRAIPLRMRFGNFADRYYPEGMAAQIALGRAAHARYAERRLMEDIRAASTQINGGPVNLGAYRDYISRILVATDGIRYRHRMADSTPMRAIIPQWLVHLLYLDLVYQAPGDNTIARTDAMADLTRGLSVGNVRPIFQIDDARTNNTNGAGGISFSNTQGAALLEYPGRVETILYPEGSFTFLDGGTLDFGLTIRDSTLNATNRFEMFFETFEGVMFKGVESYDLTIPLCANGAAGALVTSDCGAIGS